MTKDEELQEAYNKLDDAEQSNSRLKKRIYELHRVRECIIAAGLLSDDKFKQAEELVEMFDKEPTP